jgi:peptidyl-prolyl cis-trans isomerase D
MNSALDEFEAARDSGASVAEAARSAGLEVTAVAGIDQANRNPEGALVGLPPPLLRAAFAAEQGEVSDRIALGSTEAWVAVDRITPATLRPLDEVRADVVSGWTAQKRQQRLQALGQSVVQAIANGQTLPEAARANRMSVVASSQELQRSAFAAANPQGLAARIPPDLAQEIFAARQGGVVSAVNPEAEAVWVAIVEEIRRTDPASNPQAVQDIRARLEFDCRPGQNRPPPCLRASLADAVEADMVGAANVRRNPDRLRAMFGLSQNREGEGAQ